MEILDDPLAFIRTHPQMFLAQVSGEELALKLLPGIRLLTHGPVGVTHAGGWRLVAVEVDWLGAVSRAAAHAGCRRKVRGPHGLARLAGPCLSAR